MSFFSTLINHCRNQSIGNEIYEKNYLKLFFNNHEGLPEVPFLPCINVTASILKLKFAQETLKSFPSRTDQALLVHACP